MAAFSQLLAEMALGRALRTATLAVLLALAVAPWASAQNMVGPPDLSLPDYTGTGLSGLYYDNGEGFSSAQGSSPNASFTATNVCFPDCQGTEFLDDAGGLAAFTNGNATNIAYLNGYQPRTTWNNSELDLTGYIAITQPGEYNFVLSSDDSSYLFIQGQQVGSLQYFSQPGLYAIAIQFFEFGGGSQLDFTGTYIANGTQTCYFGCYVDGQLQPATVFFDNNLDAAPAPKIGSGLPAFAMLALLGAGCFIRRRSVRT